ncbi:LuxR C-terminal-related transcriptional regulator [Leifsonia aquatica]|uniref:LuxR C-terminal-related transcriptional regulator n=1 Tax=Leifsonia aquatica TaxID=144185 RepID=UPI0028ACC28F|nr:LuxR C-terminal-related transcriptional regulator [Leifsonia aquatica]
MPIPSALVTRPRLLEKLDADVPIVIVEGPSGCGKSTLLAHWVRSDADRMTLWCDYAATAGSFWSQFADLLSLPHASLPQLAEQLAAIDRTIVAVIDDCADDPALLAQIRIVTRAAGNVRFVIATRHAPAMTDLSESCDIDQTVIGARELMFRQAEARELVTLLAGPHDPDEVYLADTVLPLAARLIGIALARGNYGAFDWNGRGRAQVAEVLVRRTMSRIPDSDLLAAAMRLAAAERVDQDLCERLLATDRACSVLDELEHLGIGFSTIEGDRRIFTLVPLLRQGYFDELCRRHPGEVADLRRVTALWCLENDRPLEAIRNAVAIGDFYLAARAAKAGWLQLAGPDLRATGECLGSVPRALIGRHAVLSVLAGLAVDHVRSGQARAYFEDALTALRRVGSTMESDAVWTLTLRAISRRALGESAYSARAAHAAACAAEQLPKPAQEELGTTLAALMLECSRCLLSAGATVQAVHAAESGMRWADGIVREQLVLVAAVGYAIDGHVATALRLFPDAGRRERLAGPMAETLRLILCAENVAPVQHPHHGQLSTDGAQADWALVWASGLHALSAGESERGCVAVGDAVATLPKASTGRSRVTLMHCLLLIATGQSGRADHVLSTLPRRGMEAALVRSLRSAQGGRTEDALREVSTALRAPVEDNPRVSAAACAVASACLHRLGRPAASERLLRRSAALATQHGLTTPTLVWSRRHRPQDQRPGALAPAGWLARAEGCEPLTARERAVLEQLIEHDSRQALADALGVSINTVKTQLRSLYRKLGATDRQSALLNAVDLGMLAQRTGTLHA